MAITLGRQLTDDEKDRVVQQHGRVCFATGHTVGDDEPVWFDHIRAFSTGGMSETNNIAPMCATGITSIRVHFHSLISEPN